MASDQRGYGPKWKPLDDSVVECSNPWNQIYHRRISRSGRFVLKHWLGHRIALYAHSLAICLRTVDLQKMRE